MAALLSVRTTSGELLRVELRYNRTLVDVRLDGLRCVWIGGPYAEVFDLKPMCRIDRFRVEEHACVNEDLDESHREAVVDAFVNWWECEVGPGSEVHQRRVAAVQSLLYAYPPAHASDTHRRVDRFEFGRWVGIAECPSGGRYVLRTAATREACLKSIGVDRTIWGVRPLVVVDLDTGTQFAAA